MLKYQKTHKERESSQSDIQSILKIVRNLSKKIEMLENEIETLKKTQFLQKRKRISEVLNYRNCNIEWYDWIKDIVVTEYDIEQILKENIIMGIKHVFENLLCKINIEEIPVVAFIQKENNIYIYDQEKWRLAKKNDFIHIVEKISNLFISAFFKWSSSHTYKDNEPKEFEYLDVVYGAKISQDKKIAEFKKFLFSRLKINLEKDTIDDLEDADE
jgi:hypothetical protein